MSNLNPLLDRNRAFVGNGHEVLSPLPNHQLFIVTCMDGRVDPAHFLGVGLGDALVIRNAGGRVTDEVVDEIVFIATVTETMLGDEAQPFEVAVVHHTGCGTGLLADDAFRTAYATRLGVDESVFRHKAVTEPEASVRADVELLRTSAVLPTSVSVSGHVYDLDTGVVATVVAPLTSTHDAPR
ncbi:MAG: carbonic anhydrase [Actinomycetota bacterium]